MESSDIITSAREFLNPKDVEVAFNHHPCSDGTAAAACALDYNSNIMILPWYNDDNIKSLNMEMWPINHGSDVRTTRTKMSLQLHITGKNVVFFDCAPPTWLLSEMSQFAKKVLILDHHKSNEDDYRGVELESNTRFYSSTAGTANSLSGCGLAWKYFSNLEMPRFMQLIQKRDLWKLDEEVETFVAYFYNSKKVLLTPRAYVEYIHNPDKMIEVMEVGKILLEEKRKIVAQEVSRATHGIMTFPDAAMPQLKPSESPERGGVCQIIGRPVIYTNRPRPAGLIDYLEPKISVGVVYTAYTEHVSDIGNELAKLFEVAVIAQKIPSESLVERNAKYKMSLRSADGSDVDVGKIAKRFKGGGHMHAGAFISYLYFRNE